MGDQVIETDNWYRMLVERVPAVVYVDASDETSSAIYMNPQSQDMLGYAPGEWISDPELWVKILHPGDRERTLAEVERTRKTGEPFKMEYRLITHDGRVVWVHDEAALIKDNKKSCRQWWGVLLDITERKEMERRLKESEELFKVTFDAAGVGIAHISPNGQWLRVNEKLLEISGYSRQELLSRTYLDMTPAADWQNSFDRTRKILDGDLASYSVEKRYVRKNGSRIWINLSVSLVRKPSGEPDFLVCVAEDITKRKLTELVPDALTDREMEILEFVAHWHTDCEIARRLAYSQGSIKSYVRRILAKLGVENRRRAATKAVEIGLISPPRW